MSNIFVHPACTTRPGYMDAVIQQTGRLPYPVRTISGGYVLRLELRRRQS